MYVLDANNADLLERTVPPEVLEAVKNPVQDSEGFHYNRLRVRKINNTDGKPVYTAVASYTGSPLLRMLYRRPNTFWMHVAAAMVISAVFSLLLAAYITAPLRASAAARGASHVVIYPHASAICRSDAAPKSLRSPANSTDGRALKNSSKASSG